MGLGRIRFMRSRFTWIVLALMIATQGGCVRRTITVVSDPPGALVWLNDREIGRTPVTTDFLFYGRYDIRLFLDGYEPVQTFADAKAPWWDSLGLDLAAEAMPAEPHAKIVWNFTLMPVDSLEPELLSRAADLRKITEEQASAEPPPPTEPVSSVEDDAN